MFGSSDWWPGKTLLQTSCCCKQSDAKLEEIDSKPVRGETITSSYAAAGWTVSQSASTVCSKVRAQDDDLSGYESPVLDSSASSFYQASTQQLERGESMVQASSQQLERGENPQEPHFDITELPSFLQPCGITAPHDSCEPCADDESPLEFRVFLNKTLSNSRVSIDIDYGDGKTLRVRRLRPGLVTEWNEANPALQVEVGDIILEINGTADDSRKLLFELLHAPALDMHVKKRIASFSSQPTN
mmetsp:Transcript_65324/g.103499  ORF Transcript_65324/g.103499 Transcript_65324/m.103499 type:complete len:244 (+) Transcript_65324:34-765(+)